jgi:tRNA-uridine 2-sulfurtransferase
MSKININCFSKKKIVVGVSGGVDSSLALALLKSKGYQPIALYLQIPIWNSITNNFEINIKNTKHNLDIIKDVCSKLDVPYFVLDVSNNFKKTVVNYFIKNYKNLKTPNPCVFCNRFFKFKYLLDFANKNNIYFVASGHYSKIMFSKKENIYKLAKAKDKTKDQSYGLSLLSSNQLKRIKFPLGNYTKKEIYVLLDKYNFSKFKKEKQSQDICFLKNTNINKFLLINIKTKPGEIININNKKQVLGKHNGLFLYTTGQRKGLGLNKQSYVCGFNKTKNQLLITNNKNDLKYKEIYLINYNFINGKVIKKKEEFLCKTRYQQKENKAIIYPPKNNKLKVVFYKPQPFISKGQYLVFYKKQYCCGCGVIENYK